jgi:hypothetical protein
LHFKEGLDISSAHAKVATQKCNPGDKPRTHLTGRGRLRKLGDNGSVATRTGCTETLVFCDGIGNLGKVENLMSILWVRIDHDLATTEAAGIREVTLDLIDFGFRDDLTGIPDMPRLGASFLVGGFAMTLSLGLS